MKSHGAHGLPGGMTRLQHMALYRAPRPGGGAVAGPMLDKEDQNSRAK